MDKESEDIFFKRVTKGFKESHVLRNEEATKGGRQETRK